MVRKRYVLMLMFTLLADFSLAHEKVVVIPLNGSKAETVALSADSTTMAAGAYAATTLENIDSDLSSANIKSGVTIFGINGDSNVVNTSSGDAVAGDIAANKVVWVDGVEVIGTATIATAATSPSPVARTGQTPTVPRDVTGITGADGNLQKGVTWPNPRFTASNGTVTDHLTGLVWLQNANCTDTVGGVDKSSGVLTWSNGLSWSNNLANGDCNLTDGSSAGDWRLPNVLELQSLIAWQYEGPALSNDTGTGKWVNDASSAFVGVQSNPFYWSSTPRAESTTWAWTVSLNDGYVYFDNDVATYYVWPVRE